MGNERRTTGCRPGRVSPTALVYLGLALLALAVSAALPTAAHAVLNCNAQANISFPAVAGQGPAFGLPNDVYILQANIGTGSIGGGSLNTQSISRIRYNLDCVNTTSCTDEGAVAEYEGDLNISNITNCLDATGSPIDAITTNVGNSPGSALNEVIFTFKKSGVATPVSLGANVAPGSGCSFRFKVKVLTRSGNNGDTTPNRIEERLFYAAGDAVCDNSLSANLSQSAGINLCPDCNDNNACTTDSCTQSTGQCVNTPITCNDSNACTTDTCNPATGCVFTPITCNDNNICTDDTCNPATGCVFTFDPTNDPSCAPPVGCPAPNPLFGLGQAANFSVLELNGGSLRIGTGSTKISGNVGVGDNSTGSSLIKATIDGFLKVDCDVPSISIGGDLTVTCGKLVGPSCVQLDTPVNDALAASTTLGALAADQTFTNITTPTTISATKDGLNVIKVTGSINLSGDKDLTFDRAGHNNVAFVVNILGTLICFPCQVVINAPLTFSDVLFNVLGAGSGVIVKSPSTFFQGTILAPLRACTMDKGKLTGGHLCGGNILIHSGGQICPGFDFVCP